MVDVEDATSNLVHDLGSLLLGSECFDGDFGSMRRMRLATECDFRRLYMVNTRWSKPSFFRPTVSETGLSFGSEMLMWYFPN